jgi:hypothetical protein
MSMVLIYLENQVRVRGRIRVRDRDPFLNNVNGAYLSGKLGELPWSSILPNIVF